MTEQMKKERIRQALDTEFAFMNTTPSQRRQLLSAAMGERKMKKRMKLSVALVMVLALMSLAFTAYAITTAIQQYYAHVAEMDADGALIRWEMWDKIDFVNLMKGAEFEVNPTDLEIMNDETRPDAEREAAADRIIEERYGKLILEKVGRWDDMGMDVRQNTMGVPPDETIIFKERYLAEHPEGLNTAEDWMLFIDALGYYLRDEYYPAYEAAKGEEKDAVPTRPPVDEAYAVQCLRSYMTEVLSWTPVAVEAMEPTVEWDADYQIWTVSGEVPESSMKPEMEPVTKDKKITKTESGYRLTLMVDSFGSINVSGEDKATFYHDSQRDHAAPSKITSRQAEELAAKAVMEKYGLTETELNRYFCDGEQIGLGEQGGALYAMRFHTHFAYNCKNMYCAYVNMTTGKAETVFSYRPEDLPAEWGVLTYAAQCEQHGKWFLRWSSEEKQQLLQLMADAGIIMKQDEERNPDEAAAEAFGISGYASMLNFTVMAHRLLGPEDGWDVATRGVYEDLRNQYFIRSQDMTEQLNLQASEIDGEQAIKIIREAVCLAWDMQPAALDNWEAVAQLRQDSTQNQSQILYQVFLTRPREERGQDTFSGKNSMMYRVRIDGTVMDAGRMPGWYSPAQDRAVTEEAKLYDGEIWRYFDTYAEAHDLMDRKDFFHWPIEEKANCAKEMGAMIEEKINADPDFADPRLLALTRHTYGLPTENELSEDKAKTLSWEQLESAFGLTANQTVFLRPAGSFFDVTDPDKPVWKIVYSAEENSYSAQEAGMNPSLYYAIRLDARTGEFLSACSYGSKDGKTGVDAWNQWF